jgi:Restriction endonuclease S subunits
MTMNKTTLGECVDFSNGYAFKSKFFSNDATQIPLVKGENLGKGSIHWEESKYWPLELTDGLEKFFLEVDDLVLAMDRPWVNDGLKFAWIKEGDPRALLVQRVGRLRANGRIDKVFLRYVIRSGEFGNYIKNIMGGVGVPHISPQQIKSFEFELPTLSVQRKIASILSAYDDLIENNLKRIKLLEEAAQNIYKEWFVNFRINGEQLEVNKETGLPEGWTQQPLFKVCTSIEDGDWIESKDQGGESRDYRIVQVSNIGVNSFVETGNWRYITENTFKKLRCREIVNGDILVSRMPNGIGRSWLVTEKQYPMVTVVDVAIIKANTSVISSFYLNEVFNSSRHIQECEIKATGTTRKRITKKVLSEISHTVPPANICQEFEHIVKPIYHQKNNLRKSNSKLKEARDLLLPRLMDGTLEV